jgi:hypothetical protein
MFDEFFDLPRGFLGAEQESGAIFVLDLGNMVKIGLKRKDHFCGYSTRRWCLPVIKFK